MALREGNPQLLRSCAEQAGRVIDGRVIEFDADDAANLIVRSAWEQLQAETP